MTSVKQIKRVYYLIISLFWLATALPLALMVLLLQSRGLDLFQLGIAMGVYSLTIVLLEVPTGGLADSIGRKRVALLAYSFMFLAGIVMLFAFSFPAFLLGWVLSGVGRALSSGALDAWFIDSLQEADPEIDIQPALATAGTFTLFALGAGTLIGGAIPRLVSGLPAEGTAVLLTPYSMTLVLALIVTAILIAAVAILVREVKPAAASDGWKEGFRQVPAVVRDAFDLSRGNTNIVLLLGVTLATGLALASIETFWSPHFAGLLGGIEGNSLFFGFVMAGNFIVGMFGNIASVPLSRLVKKRYGLLAAVFQGGQGLLLILLALQGLVIPAVGLFWMVYFSMGVLNSPHATLVNEEIPAERRSSMLSVQSLAGYLGAIVGSVILGFVAQNMSIAAAWIVAGTVLMLSLTLYLRVDTRRSRQEKTYDSEAPILDTN